MPAHLFSLHISQRYYTLDGLVILSSWSLRLQSQSTRYLYSDVDQPTKEENTEVDGVDDSQCSQVNVARHAAQVRAGENETRYNVADDADADDDRDGDEVHHVNETREVDVASVVAVAVPQRVDRRNVPRCRRVVVLHERRFHGRHRRCSQNHGKSCVAAEAVKRMRIHHRATVAAGAKLAANAAAVAADRQTRGSKYAAAAAALLAENEGLQSLIVAYTSKTQHRLSINTVSKFLYSVESPTARACRCHEINKKSSAVAATARVSRLIS